MRKLRPRVAYQSSCNWRWHCWHSNPGLPGSETPYLLQLPRQCSRGALTMTCGGLQSPGSFCGQRTAADRHLVGERPGLARARVQIRTGERAGWMVLSPEGWRWLSPVLCPPPGVPRAVSLGTGHLPGPLAGREQCLRQEAGRLGAVPAHLGSAWCWLELSSGRCLGSAVRAQLGGCEAEPRTPTVWRQAPKGDRLGPIRRARFPRQLSRQMDLGILAAWPGGCTRERECRRPHGEGRAGGSQRRQPGEPRSGRCGPG